MLRQSTICFLTTVLVAGHSVPARALSNEDGARSDPAAVEDPTRTACLTEEQKALLGQDEAAARAVLPDDARIIPPNSMITQDHRPNRVNVDLDEAGKVIRIWCG